MKNKYKVILIGILLFAGVLMKGAFNNIIGISLLGLIIIFIIITLHFVEDENNKEIRI